ncbi:MAG: hypothetical protein L0G22_11850 [Propionibacteriaceae bacterium]|nr:hypothetical protein [Propionibacteriaceae bacterium]
MTQNLPLAISLVVVGSFCFALSAHLQHRAVDNHLEGNAHKSRMRWAQLLSTIRSPRWILGLLFMGTSFALQTVALTMAPVSLVQPVGLLAFPWSVILAARTSGQHLPKRVLFAVAGTVGATLAFTIVTALHAAPESDLVVSRVVLGALVVYGVAITFATLGTRGPYRWRCLFWGSGGALFYGLEASLMKALIEFAKAHDWVHSVEFWGIVVALGIGALAAGWFIQQGYATGPAEVVVGSMTVTSPVVAVAFGIAVLGEGVNITSNAALWMALLGLLAVAGVAVLARYHPDGGRTAPPDGLGVGRTRAVR